MRKLLLFACALFGFMACTQNPIEEQSAIRHETPDTITIGFEGDDTRIQLNEAQKTVWTEGDLVSVFYKSYDNLKFEFEGNTGDRNGTLKRVGGQHNGQTMDDVVVVYPYSADYMITLSEGCVNATIPSTQTYLKGSYGVGDNLMIARSSFNQFSLKSVCGWLKIQLTGAGEVIERITFRGNNGEQVAGLVYVDATTAEATLATAKHNSDDNSQLDGTLVLDDSIYTEVTIDCGEGVTLGAEPTAFYIALPPQTFANGFTVEIEDTDGYIMEQSTAKTFVVERNTISPMAVLEFVNQTTPTAPKPANNEIWYTATAKVEPTFDDFLTFGSDVVSNVWDRETKRGIITFDGDVTMIGDDAFNNCDKFTGITIPESVTSIGKNAFYDCDGLTEFIIPDSVTSIGQGAFADCSSLTSVTIPDSVTTIGDAAFYGCSSLTSVTIHDSVTSIGEWAFYDCSSLTSVTIPDSVTTIGDAAFNGCSSLTSVTIPDSVTEIGYAAFAYCSSLTSVTIPDSVTSIGDGAFAGCSSLQEFKGKFASKDGRCLIIDGTLNAFAPAGLTEYTIPDSVTSIGNSAFSHCESLTSVTIPDSVTTIEDYAFYGCSSLGSITIPDSVTSIGEWAFSDCHSLKKVYCNATIPPSLGNNAFSYNANGRRIYVYEECVEVYKSAWSSYKDSIYTNGQNCPDTTTIKYTTTDGNTITSSKLPIISNSYDNGVGTMVISGIITVIPDYAFSRCSSLTSVTIPDSVTSIGDYAFNSCSSLTSVTIPDSVTSIGSAAFRDCSRLASITIPDSVTSIGSEAFSNCSSLTSVTIPDSVTSIGEKAFYYCSNLTSVTIPDSVTSIGEKAFYYCSNLTSVTIPDSVTLIGSAAFRDCSRLTSVYCKATTPPAGGSNMFYYNASGRKIYVPVESVEAYKSASYWREYADAIVGYNF